MLDTQLTWELETSVEGLKSLVPHWFAALRNSAMSEVVQSPMWLLNWWQSYGGLEARRLCVVVFKDAERVVGLAPLCLRRYWHHHSIPLMRLELLGSGEPREHETGSEYLGLIAEKGYEQGVADTFATAINGDSFPAWDELVLTRMNGESVLPALLTRSLGMAVEYRIVSGAPFVRLPSTWEAYLATLSSSQRALVGESLHAWEEWTGKPPRLRRVTQEHELGRTMELLKTLHNERRNAAGRRGVFESELFSRFHQEVARELLQAGALWLSWLEVDSRPIAVLYNFVWQNQVRFYQSGCAMAVPKTVRAGLVAHACAIRQAIEQGMERYDFLGGTFAHKLQLANDVRPVVELTLHRSSVRDSLRRMADQGAAVVRALRER